MLGVSSTLLGHPDLGETTLRRAVKYASGSIIPTASGSSKRPSVSLMRCLPRDDFPKRGDSLPERRRGTIQLLEAQQRLARQGRVAER